MSLSKKIRYDRDFEESVVSFEDVLKVFSEDSEIGEGGVMFKRAGTYHRVVHVIPGLDTSGWLISRTIKLFKIVNEEGKDKPHIGHLGFTANEVVRLLGISNSWLHAQKKKGTIGCLSATRFGRKRPENLFLDFDLKILRPNRDILDKDIINLFRENRWH